MKKTYRAEPNSRHFFRIGKTLISVVFTNGEYTIDNPLVQQAIENSHAFKEGRIIHLKQEE